MSIRVGFDFGRQLGDPEFREFLRVFGSARQRIIPAGPDTTIGDILHRVEANEVQSPFLVVVADASQRFGFRFLVGDVSLADQEDG